MDEPSESDEYNLDESEETLYDLQKLGQEYDLNDLVMEDEKEAVQNAAGVIRTFYDVSQSLSDARGEGYDETDVYNAAIRTGQLWPEANRAREVLKDIAESGEITDKILYGCLTGAVKSDDRLDTAPGINSSRQKDVVDNTIEVYKDIEEVDQLYREAEATAQTEAQFMLIDGEKPNPINIAREKAEDEGYDEFIEHLEEVRKDMHETEEEMDQAIMKMADEILE